MPKVILSDDRHYRYNMAVRAMDELMAPDNIGNARKGREKMSHIERHLSAAGVTIGVFLEDYFVFKIPEQVNTTEQSFKCACNRMFRSKQALSGHKRTCKS